MFEVKGEGDHFNWCACSRFDGKERRLRKRGMINVTGVLVRNLMEGKRD